MRHAALALLLGPAAVWLAGRPRRAVVLGVAWAIAVLAWPYAHFLNEYMAIYEGGDTARELTDTAIAANRSMLLAFRAWLPATLVTLVAANAACAADLARLARRPAPEGAL